MTLEDYCEQLGKLYERVGRQPLEGRLVALLLCQPEPFTLSRAARALGVTKMAVSRLANQLIARGDLKRSRLSSTREHAYEIVDDAYIGDLRERLGVSRSIVELSRAFSSELPAHDPRVVARLQHHASIHERVSDALESALEPEEAVQAADLRAHG